MKRRLQTIRALPALTLVAALLAACAPAQPAATPVPTASAAPAATPAPTASPAVTAEPSPTPEPTATPTPSLMPTAAPLPQTTLEEWAAAMPQTPEYDIAEGPIQLQDYVAWPDQPVTLELLSWNGTLEEAAEAYHVPLETLLALNPDPEMSDHTSDGSTVYYYLKLQDDYIVPKPMVKYVTVSTPWVENSMERTDNYMVPATLSDQAAACMATAYDFQYEHYGMHVGIEPSEQDEESGLYSAVEGALCTTYTELTQYLGNIYTPEYCDKLLGGPEVKWEGNFTEKIYYQGENDTICFQAGDRGSNIAYCGKSFTEPELQPDGSIEFWQLSLTVESDDFAGWGQGITYTPDTASASLVRLEPTETGWRVAALALPN